MRTHRALAVLSLPAVVVGLLLWAQPAQAAWSVSSTEYEYNWTEPDSEYVYVTKFEWGEMKYFTYKVGKRKIEAARGWVKVTAQQMATAFWVTTSPFSPLITRPFTEEEMEHLRAMARKLAFSEYETWLYLTERLWDSTAFEAELRDRALKRAHHFMSLAASTLENELLRPQYTAPQTLTPEQQEQVNAYYEACADAQVEEEGASP